MSKVFYKKRDIQKQLASSCQSIGLVPTMGNLHQGHMDLLERSIQENDISVISIFINPTQFSKNEDFDSYPKTFKKDLELILYLQKKYNKEVLIFYPEDKYEVYEDDQLLNVKRFENELEGEVRPTHFKGVITVVKHLFDIVRPSRAYFGKKDYQQIIVIKDMVENNKLSVEIVPCAITRSIEGLALSSRNNYLTNKELEEALILRNTLMKASQILMKDGFTQTSSFLQEMLNSRNFNYLEMRSMNTFHKASQDDKKIVILGNYQIKQTRLLDNIEVHIT